MLEKFGTVEDEFDWPVVNSRNEYVLAETPFFERYTLYVSRLGLYLQWRILTGDNGRDSF
jgi:hypothetical protein